MLTVKGDSMVDAGCRNNAGTDTVIVKKGAPSNLVSCHSSNVGYKRLSLSRAFSAVNCQFTLART